MTFLNFRSKNENLGKISENSKPSGIKSNSPCSPKQENHNSLMASLKWRTNKDLFGAISQSESVKRGDTSSRNMGARIE